MKKISKFLSLICLLFSSSCEEKLGYERQEYDNYVLHTNMKYGDYARNYLDLCLPKNIEGEVGLVLCIHGGGWAAGSKDNCRDIMKSYCHDYHYASMAISYRYADKKTHHEELLEDIYNALSFAKTKALEEHITLNKVALIGGSAGAHLSLLYAYKMKEISPILPVLAISLSGPTDFNDMNFYDKTNANHESINKMISYISGYNINDENITQGHDILKLSSPINYVDDKCVPTIICHGMKDDVVPYSNAERLHNKLNEFGIKNEFFTYPNSGHGLENDSDINNLANQKILEYMQALL